MFLLQIFFSYIFVLVMFPVLGNLWVRKQYGAIIITMIPITILAVVLFSSPCPNSALNGK